MDWRAEPGQLSLYGWITLLGLLIGGWLWSRRWRSRPESFSIFVGAVCGAFLGAKLLFLLAEGWLYLGEEGWIEEWLSGKTIVGALLGGYAGVEFVKWLIQHREPTGDWFAVGVPLSIAIGRLGCLNYGCCLGIECEEPTWWTLTDAGGTERWPAVPAELIFNLAFVAAVLPVAMRSAGRGQLFHVYLIAYGSFRFCHGFFRETPDVVGPLSGYQIGALALIGLGSWRGWQRWQQQRVAGPSLKTRENEPPCDSASEAE